MFFVLFKDDFGDRKIAKFKTYDEAYDFFKCPSNVVFPIHLLTEAEVWDYCVSQRHA